jgi:hypothetical protein
VSILFCLRHFPRRRNFHNGLDSTAVSQKESQMAEDPETTLRPRRAPRWTIVTLGVVLLLALVTLLFVWPKLGSSNRSEPQTSGSQAPPAKQPAP